ncbi:conserved hypothetical protein [Pyrobaculum islandicum DSM 4184]|uniref:Uncharacterized protein n=1 Tax=Pyrobaculum islandicum (strain DSM 4184 / JCM 9189 / GEO3) TaxID=384616 RepID=A1RV35_PYRIL|nr:hypothetical protein [Pyrobaculum islandicum]ABL88817.1 conserved hypothetical protein [Pyrobaculum islandicum DSM 4184]
MNLTLEILSSLTILTLGILLVQRLQHDYKLVNILRNYPLPTLVKSGSIIDLEKLYIFIQNFNYKIETKGNIQLDIKNNILRITSGGGEIVIILEAWGYLDFYKVQRVIKVVE